MYKVKIRGIFATALSKLALDRGFSIVQPTEVVARRLGLLPDNSPPDFIVKDHESKSGIVVMGDCGAVETFAKVLKEELDPFLVQAAGGVKEVFAARPLQEAGATYVVTPEGGRAVVPSRYVVYPSVRLFTLVKPPVGPAKGLALPEIIVAGRYVELDTIGGVKFSRGIGEEDVVRLRILAESRLGLQGLGVKFKSSAQYAQEEEILREAQALYEEMLRISSGPWREGEVVRRGECLFISIFDREVKAKLDEIRARVAPTIRGHHSLRAQGLGRCLDLLDYAGAEVYEKASEFLATMGPVEILHIKPWGDIVRMRGSPLGFRNGALVVKRNLRPGGTLDGIGARIEPGFYALTCIKPGLTYVVHTYYDAVGRVVGTYINVNTPPEIGRRIIYVDLLLDKAIKSDGEERVLDMDELEKYRGYFPKRFERVESLLPKGRLECTEEGLIS